MNPNNPPTSQDGLKPCPLCNSAAFLFDTDWRKGWYVQCTNAGCHCETRKLDSKEAALKLWNTRSASQ